MAREEVSGLLDEELAALAKIVFKESKERGGGNPPISQRLEREGYEKGRFKLTYGGAP